MAWEVRLSRLEQDHSFSGEPTPTAEERLVSNGSIVINNNAALEAAPRR